MQWFEALSSIGDLSSKEAVGRGPRKRATRGDKSRRATKRKSSCDGVYVRVARTADVPTMLRMKWALAIQQRVEHAMRATEADWLRDGFGAHARFKAFVAEQDQAVVGMVTCTETYYTSWAGTMLEVHDLFVEPVWRGSGVASALLARVAAHAVANGVPQVELTTRHDNPARTLYRRLGFERVRHAVSYVMAGPALAQLASTVPAPTSPVVR